MKETVCNEARTHDLTRDILYPLTYTFPTTVGYRMTRMSLCTRESFNTVLWDFLLRVSDLVGLEWALDKIYISFSSFLSVLRFRTDSLMLANKHLTT
jgi:hypothetical protein